MKELHIKLSQAATGEYQAEIADELPPGAEGFDPPPNAGWPCQLQLPAPLAESNLELQDFQGYLLGLKQGDTENELEAIGMYLNEFLFGPQNNRNVLSEYWDRCFHESPEVLVDGMRTVLRIDDDNPVLLGVPWELWNKGGDYFAVQPCSTLVRTAWKANGPLRREPVPLPGPNTREPLRVLLIISHRRDDDTVIKGPDEALSVDKALFRLLPWMVDLHILTRPTIPEVREWCEHWEPHIFHFVGHGSATAEGRPYLLMYGSGQDEATRIYENAMINLFPRKVPRLVVLNACRSGQVGGGDTGITAARTTQSFSRRLIQQGVLAVIAMQADIQGEDAVALMGHFYHKLAEGKAIDSALTRARFARFGATNSNLATEKWDWALPALYLALDVRAEEVLHLDGAEAEPRIFSSMANNASLRHLPLPLGVKLQVGREKEQLKLAKTVLAQDLSTIPPVTFLHGVQEIGKTTMLCWLSERCTRLERPFIYADCGGASLSLNYWNVLRLIRDGRRKTEATGGLALDNCLHLKTDVTFNTFNDALNRKSSANYVAEHPQQPDENTAVPEEVPTGDPTSGMEYQGTVRAEESAFETITKEFWESLKRIARQNGLVIFLDHIEKLSIPTIVNLRKYLIEPRVLAARNEPSAQGIHLVLALREIDPNDEFEQDEGDVTAAKAWNFLSEIAQKGGSKVERLRFEKLPKEQLYWLARVWARRYFISCKGANYLRTRLENLLNGRPLKPEYVDAYVKRRIDSYGPGPVSRAPGMLIHDLLEKQYIEDWFKLVENAEK